MSDHELSDPPPARTGHVCVIVVAAGSGTRFGAKKQFVELQGRTVLERSVGAALSVAQQVVVVVPNEDVDQVRTLLDWCAGSSIGVDVIAGGATRSDSVRCGLRRAALMTDFVLIHDGARPLATPDLFHSVVGALRNGAAAAVPGVDIVDSLRWKSGGPIDRAGVLAVQTPQGFNADVLRSVHQNAPEWTDDAGLVEAAGHEIRIVPGEAANIKITSPSDAAIAEVLLRLADLNA